MIEITPEFALNYVKYSSILVGTWPPKSDASRSTKLIFEIWWWISLSNLIFIIIPLIYSSFVLKNDPLNSLKFLFLALNAIQCVIKMIICKRKYYRFRFLLEELQECVINSKPHERKVYSRYIKNHGMIYVLIMFGALVAATIIVSGALYQPQLLPIDALYPFHVEYHPVRDIIYILQVINGFQVGSITVIDTQVALLLWFSIARLDILGEEIENASDMIQLRACIQKHQYLLWLIGKIIKTTRFIILTTVVMCMLSIILGSTHILGNDLIVKLQCISTALVLTFILYMNAYPAEFLIHASSIAAINPYIFTRYLHVYIREKLNLSNSQGLSIGLSAWSAYDSSEMKKTIAFDRCLIFIIHKSQRPSLIKFEGIIPSLSLTYYRAFLAKTFSFFTTLRIVLKKMDEDK